MYFQALKERNASAKDGGRVVNEEEEMKTMLTILAMIASLSAALQK